MTELVTHACSFHLGSRSSVRNLTKIRALVLSLYTNTMTDLVLTVLGGVLPFLRGAYHEDGSHHGKPVYRKEEPAFTLSVFYYFWDGHDNIAYRGWWFGPFPGEQQTWAFHSAPKQRPPRIGWRVPYNGDIDWSMTLTGAWIGMCTYIAWDGQRCPEKAADDCEVEMCKEHCALGGRECARHISAWQMHQNEQSRSQRANRRRGGKRTYSEFTE